MPHSLQKAGHLERNNAFTQTYTVWLGKKQGPSALFILPSLVFSQEFPWQNPTESHRERGAFVSVSRPRAEEKGGTVLKTDVGEQMEVLWHSKAPIHLTRQGKPAPLPPLAFAFSIYWMLGPLPRAGHSM